MLPVLLLTRDQEGKQEGRAKKRRGEEEGKEEEREVEEGKSSRVIQRSPALFSWVISHSPLYFVALSYANCLQ